MIEVVSRVGFPGAKWCIQAPFLAYHAEILELTKDDDETGTRPFDVPQFAETFFATPATRQTLLVKLKENKKG